MRVLGLVPARAASKRLPGKNREALGGVALWRRAVHCALAAGLIPAVSSDDDEVLSEARIRGVFVIPRPADLARDDTPMLPVVLHAVDTLEDPELDMEFDAVAVLQPTSPFRMPEDIWQCIRIMEATNADAVVSVTDAAADMAFRVRHAGRLERLPDMVVENGAVYLLRVAALKAGLGFYGGELYSYRMPKDRSLDIDTPLDLEIARTIMDRNGL